MIRDWKIYFVIFFLHCFPWACKSQTGEDAVQLHQYLFNPSGYNKRVRPRKNQTHPVQVNLSFTLSSIQELNSAGQKLSLVGVLHVEWIDEFLTWNTTQFGGVRTIEAFQDEIWHPQLYIGDPADDLSTVGVSSTPLKIMNNGYVMWNPADVLTFRCAVNTRLYPIDTQVCYLDFITKGYSMQELSLISSSDNVNLERFQENVEWELISAKSHIAVNNLGQMTTQRFRNSLTLKRRSAFIIVHSVVPIVFLSILNILVFVLPAESGEKISLSITMFLAFAIFLTMLSDSLPKNSITLPIFSVYIILVNGFSTLYVILTAVVLNVYHKSDKNPIPQFLRSYHLLLRRSQGLSAGKVEHKDAITIRDSQNKKNTVETGCCISIVFEKPNKRFLWRPDSHMDRGFKNAGHNVCVDVLNIVDDFNFDFRSCFMCGRLMFLGYANLTLTKKLSRT